ncbi:hypothetical protein [Methanobacterium petrolearium]|uniref:hypothetical protein n=1 Tax=Methanobacterium petrolearium TaxID=710190 RepID=UPI001AEA173A|nr:hypothetical protein [Methanobacterium petrolearium]MBP1945196.1 hypothetical protein [Methanobacterium petrolearium]BDZ71127.1 hypothetical protein GCM10025861_16440 [Methanobacterium petrolearium]
MKIPWKKSKKAKKLNKTQQSSRKILEPFKNLNLKVNKKNFPMKNLLIIPVVLIIFIAIALLISLPWDSPTNSTMAPKARNVTLAKTNDSSVIKEGPYGNTSSNITVAFVVGVHPRESAAHEAIIESVRENDANLKKEYYLYRINAPIYENNYPAERMNGQLLAYKYVVPDITNNSYQLTVDVHSSNGSYAVNRFVFAPSYENKSIGIAKELINKIPWLYYYYPSITSSPDYLTNPLIESGNPAIIYETYKNDSNTTTKKHALKFLGVIDESTIFS